MVIATVVVVLVVLVIWDFNRTQQAARAIVASELGVSPKTIKTPFDADEGNFYRFYRQRLLDRVQEKARFINELESQRAGMPNERRYSESEYNLDTVIDNFEMLRWALNHYEIRTRPHWRYKAAA